MVFICLLLFALISWGLLHFFDFALTSCGLLHFFDFAPNSRAGFCISIMLMHNCIPIVDYLNNYVKT